MAHPVWLSLSGCLKRGHFIAKVLFIQIRTSKVTTVLVRIFMNKSLKRIEMMHA